MSFMAGFADAFVDERDRRIKREEKQEDDMFNLTYRSFLERKEANKAQAEKDKKAAATAEAIAQRYNQPVAPILSALRSGTDTSIVTDMAKSGAWEQVGGEESNEEMAPQGADAPDSVNSQTTAAMSDPTQPPAGATPVGPVFDDATRQKGFTNSINKIAEIEGRNPDEVVAEINGPREQASAPSGSYKYTARPEKREFDAGVEQQRYVDLQRAAATGDPAAKDALLQFETVELPALKAAESMFDAAPEVRLPTSREGLAVMLANAQASGDPQKIELANNTRKLYDSMMLDQAQAEGKFGSAKKSLIRGPDGRVKMGMVISEMGADGKRVFRNQSEPGSPPIDPSNVLEYNEDLNALDKTIVEQSQSKPVQEYKTKLIQATSGIRTAGQLMEMVDRDPEVLADVSSGLALTANNVVKELSAFGTLFEKAENGEEISLGEDQVRMMEREIANIDPGAIQDRASKYALFKAKTLLYIYRMGAVEGQEGRALTEADIARLETMLGASTDPTSYKENLIEYTQSNIDMLDDTARMMAQYNVAYDQYKQLTGGFVPYGIPAPTTKQFIQESGDVELQKAFDEVINAQVSNPSQQYLELQQQRAQGNEVNQPRAPVTPPPQAIEMLRNDPNLAQFFDEKYGPGASEQYLRN